MTDFVELANGLHGKIHVRIGMDLHLGVPGILSFCDANSPIGSRIYGGHLRDIGGTGFSRFRIYGMYALILLLGSSRGRFKDKLGTNRRIEAGDLIVVFPDMPHQYGPEPGDSWEEVFIAFEGAAFEGWTAHGLDPAHPVWKLDPLSEWSHRFFELLTPAASGTDSCRIAAAIHCLIADAIAAKSTTASGPPWLETVCQALAAGAAAPSLVETARMSGLGYESFRKAFKSATGESPVRFRSRMRISQAKMLLQRTDLSLEAIAHSLGYCDAFHLSKAFKKETGSSPRDFRNGSPRPPES